MHESITDERQRRKTFHSPIISDLDEKNLIGDRLKPRAKSKISKEEKRDKLIEKGIEKMEERKLR